MFAKSSCLANSLVKPPVNPYLRSQNVLCFKRNPIFEILSLVRWSSISSLYIYTYIYISQTIPILQYMMLDALRFPRVWDSLGTLWRIGAPQGPKRWPAAGAASSHHWRPFRRTIPILLRKELTNGLPRKLYCNVVCIYIYVCVSYTSYISYISCMYILYLFIYVYTYTYTYTYIYAYI